METIAADSVFFAEFQGNRIEICFRRHIGVKCRLEGSNQGRIGHECGKLTDGCNIGGIVSRSHRIEICHGLQHIFRQILDAGNTLGVNNLEAYTGNVIQRLNTAIQQIGNHSLDGFSVGGKYGIHTNGGTGLVVGVIVETFFSANTFGTTCTKYFFTAVHIEQLIFEGGTANITNQNIHATSPLKSGIRELSLSSRTLFL